MQVLKGTFNGTGATAKLCLGAIPWRFKLQNIEVATNPLTIEWSDSMLKEATCYAGIYIDAGGIPTKLTTTGCVPYEGGDLLTATNQSSTGYGEGVYLGWDLQDYRANYTYGAVSQGTPINKWTFETGLTGHFNSNGVASGCRIGLGSRISIKEDSTGRVKKSAIAVLTSTPDFTTSVYVGLTRAIGTGAITFLGGMYDLAPIAIGKVAPAGITLGSETTVNVNDNIMAFEAWID